MKLTNLIWVLALAGAVAACNSGSPITGVDPPDPGTGGTGGTAGSPGTGGTGGTGGATEGACTDDANQAVYDQLDYVNDGGEASSGTEAASAIASDCVRGSSASMPPVEGCGPEVGALIPCATATPPSCSAEEVQVLATCVEECTQSTIEEITGSRLSDECMACSGASVSCGVAFCTVPCLASTVAPECVACRCDNDCTGDFETCTGFTSDACG